MSWTAAIVDAFTQSGKTFKTFQVLEQKLSKHAGKTLVLFITQASSVASTKQVLARIRKYSGLVGNFDVCCRISEVCIEQIESVDKDVCLVDFFHKRNLDVSIEYLKKTAHMFSDVVVVIDECDAGGYTGTISRLEYIQNVENTVPDSQIHVIFITATVANLCSSLLIASQNNSFGGVIDQIIHDECVEHYFVKPHTSYVGPDWFKKTGAWNEIVFPTRKALRDKLGVEKLSREDIVEAERAEITNTIKRIPVENKRVSLIAVSTRVDDHKHLATMLLDMGFNVSIELNGAQPMSNYNVHFKTTSGEYKNWQIPMTRLITLANNGELSTIVIDRIEHETGIVDASDLTLGLVLCAAFFDENATNNKALNVIRQALSARIPKMKRRPIDFPIVPRVAMVAGHLASRGITFQDPTIGFTCTSFVFVHSIDKSSQRGATNSQKLGRACGLLGEIFAQPQNKPLLFATSKIMADAISNQQVLDEKAYDVEDGTCIKLRQFITNDDWNRVLENVKTNLKQSKTKFKKSKPEKMEKTNICPLLRLKTFDCMVAGEDVISVTDYTTYNWIDFKTEHKLNDISDLDPRNASQMASVLAAKGIEAHISIAEMSAKTVSDLANFWRNPSWCHKPWQIIVNPDDTITCIFRRVEILQNVEKYKDRVITSHNYMGELQYWRVVAE